MMNLSFILLLAVIQILISGSQANPQTISSTPTPPVQPPTTEQPPTEDPELCNFIKPNECSHETVRKHCHNLCISFCPTPWAWVGGQCFKVIDANVLRTWSRARMSCSFQDPGTDPGRVLADLAVPKDLPAFKLFIKAVGQANTQYWIGGSNLYKVTGKKAPWLWINGDPIKQFEVKPGKPVDTCSYINNYEELELNTEGCSAPLPFVCEKYVTY